MVEVGVLDASGGRSAGCQWRWESWMASGGGRAMSPTCARPSNPQTLPPREEGAQKALAQQDRQSNLALKP